MDVQKEVKRAVIEQKEGSMEGVQEVLKSRTEGWKNEGSFKKKEVYKEAKIEEMMEEKIDGWRFRRKSRRKEVQMEVLKYRRKV